MGDLYVLFLYDDVKVNDVLQYESGFKLLKLLYFFVEVFIKLYLCSVVIG